MERIKTDLLIIGAGPGGYEAAIYAKKQGLDVVLVDKAWVGGTCLNVGCIPTKALVRSTELFNELQTESLGIHFDHLSINLAEVIEKKNQVKDKLVSGIEFLLNKHDVVYIKGEAKFIDNQSILVNDQVYEAKDIIIASGSKTKHLPIEGKEFLIDSEVLLDSKEKPTSLCIIGGGIIGMEFAFIYAHMGVEVTVIEFLPRILPGIDKELAMRLIPYAKKAGIQILTGSAVKKVETVDEVKRVYYERKEKEAYVEADLVLEAVGRAPVVDGLDLENTDIVYDQRSGVKVDGYMKTNVDHIYAIGDCNGIMQLAHVAAHQGLLVVDQLLGKEVKPFNKLDVPSVIFTSPTIATVGVTEEMAKEQGIEVDVIKVPYSANGKAMILDGERGYLKIIRDKQTKRLIGGMILGKDADQLIATLTLALHQKCEAKDVYHTIFAHPTTQELVHEAVLGLDNLAIHYIE